MEMEVLDIAVSVPFTDLQHQVYNRVEAGVVPIRIDQGSPTPESTFDDPHDLLPKKDKRDWFWKMQRLDQSENMVLKILYTISQITARGIKLVHRHRNVTNVFALTTDAFDIRGVEPFSRVHPKSGVTIPLLPNLSHIKQVRAETETNPSFASEMGVRVVKRDIQEVINQYEGIAEVAQCGVDDFITHSWIGCSLDDGTTLHVDVCGPSYDEFVYRDGKPMHYFVGPGLEINDSNVVTAGTMPDQRHMRLLPPTVIPLPTMLDPFKMETAILTLGPMSNTAITLLIQKMKKGTKVQTFGLGKAEMNGLKGRILGPAGPDRIAVQLDSESIKVLPVRLKADPFVEMEFLTERQMLLESMAKHFQVGDIVSTDRGEGEIITKGSEHFAILIGEDKADVAIDKIQLVSRPKLDSELNLDELLKYLKKDAIGQKFWKLITEGKDSVIDLADPEVRPAFRKLTRAKFGDLADLGEKIQPAWEMMLDIAETEPKFEEFRLHLIEVLKGEKLKVEFQELYIKFTDAGLIRMHQQHIPNIMDIRPPPGN